MIELDIQTSRQCQMIDITNQVQKVLHDSGVTTGFAVIYVPHTTAGLTINENADPDVVHDILRQLDKIVPYAQPFYQHDEGNSAAHVKATLTGSSQTVLIQNARLLLGTWQGIWFCEYDGPRSRKAWISIFSDTVDLA